MSEFLKIALKEAENGIKAGHGGPFGAVVIKDGQIIASAHNEVVSSKDPTAHAEILAIQRAAKFLNNFDLSGCKIYITCEPCPMCLGAIMWARIDRVYYGCNRNDASKIGFDDSVFYDAIKDLATREQVLPMKQIDRDECWQVFKEFGEMQNKTLY